MISVGNSGLGHIYIYIYHINMSCLYISLGRLLGQDPTALRQEICNFLATNPKLMDGVDAETVIQWESNKKIVDYIHSMRNTNTWGGAVELSSFTLMTGHSVIVHDLSTGKTIEFVPQRRRGRPRRNIHTLHISWTGNHFEPVKIE